MDFCEFLFIKGKMWSIYPKKKKGKKKRKKKKVKCGLKSGYIEVYSGVGSLLQHLGNGKETLSCGLNPSYF